MHQPPEPRPTGPRSEEQQTADPLRRRPKRDRAATRQRLLEAARDLFVEQGYDHVSVRRIAAAADANVALVHRYFGSKAALFVEALAGESVLREVISGPPEGVARRLAEHIVRRLWEARTAGGGASPMLRALDRSVGNAEIRAILRRRVEDELIEPLTQVLDGPDARIRAMAAATIVLGAGSARRLLGLADLQAANEEDLTARLTTMLDAALRP